MRLLVIGLGSMGKRRIRDLLELEAGDIAGFDLREDRRSEARDRYGVDVYADVDEAFRSHAPDAVVVSTPPDRHAEYVALALRHGRHAFTELDLDTPSVDAMLAAARERPGVVVATSSTLRHHPAIRRMRELIQQGAFGPPLLFTYHSGQWLPDWHPWEDYRSFFASRRATGACREILAIELSWLVWVFGGVAAVHATRAKLSSLDADIDDVYQVVLSFESGTLGHVLVDAIARPAVRLLRLCTEDGTIDWDAYAPSLRRYDAAGASWHPDPLVVPGPGAPEWDAMYVREMRDFLAACRGGAPYPYTLDDERAVLRVLEAIDASASTGRRVTISGPDARA